MRRVVSGLVLCLGTALMGAVAVPTVALAGVLYVLWNVVDVVVRWLNGDTFS